MFIKLIFACCLPFLLSGQNDALISGWDKDPDLRSALYGYSIVDARTSSVVSQFNADKALVPASTLKVITTSAALGLLGKTFRYETTVCHTGTFDPLTGMIVGDLLIVGSGDPSLGSEYFDAPNVTLVEQWAAELVKKGVKGITGRILADASCFERRVPDDWIWADISNYFGVVPCGVSFMDNKFGILFRTGPPGSSATITASQAGYLNNQVEIVSDVLAKGISDQAFVYGDPFGWKKEIYGSLPAGKQQYRIEAALPDPALRCAEALYTALRKAGVKCNREAGSLYAKTASGPRTVLIRHSSPTLGQLIHHTNLQSDNLYCESILLTLGNGSRSEGLRKVTAYWKSRGLDTTQIFMSDGSGLSRANAVSAGFQATLLGKIAMDPAMFDIMNKSFPVAGKQGTMAGIGKGSPIEGRLCAKTGYINRVRAYCGYVTTTSGRLLAFSVMINNYNGSPAHAKSVLNTFMTRLADL